MTSYPVPAPRGPISGLTEPSTYQYMGVRTDCFPNNSTLTPVGIVRSDAPFSTVDAMNQAGHALNPPQLNQLAHAKPFYGVLSMEERAKLAKIK